MSVKVSPSVLSADFLTLKDDIKKLADAGADMLHLDVMDGIFVPNITFGPDMIKAIKKRTSLPLDVHLMIDSPERYIDAFASAGADIISFHVEACRHPHRTLSYIRSKGIKSGIAYNPGTSLDSLEYLIDEADMVLLMSVNPGFGGQKFIPSIVEKTRRLKQMIEEKGSNALIQIDGGVNDKTAPLLVEAGADVLVSGSYIFKAADPIKTIHELKNCK